jgi:hypothetical protein
LKKYGFGSSRRYFLRRDGRDYDSKAKCDRMVVAAGRTISARPTASAQTSGQLTTSDVFVSVTCEVSSRFPAPGFQVTLMIAHSGG